MFMRSKIFSVSQALRFGLYTVIDNFIFIVTICILYLLVALGGLAIIGTFTVIPFLSLIQTIVHTGIETVRGSLSVSAMILLIAMLFGFLCTWLILGIQKVAFDLYDYQQSSIRSLFSIDFKTTLRGFIANILYYLLTTIGFCFFIIPGIYFSLKYCFIYQILVDKHVGVFEAFRQSSEITKGIKWQLFGLALITGILGWLGMAFFGIGLVITAPMTRLAYVYVYRKLSSLPQPINREMF